MLFTVIFTSEKSKILLASYRNLFSAFEKNDDITFCQWNETGSDLISAAPDLYDKIRGKLEWRALVLYMPGPALSPSGVPSHHPENPFDFEVNKKNPEVYYEDNEANIVRFTHMLAGYPDLGSHRYNDEKLTQDNGYLDFIDLPKNVVLNRYKLTASKYRFDEHRPTEMIVFSSREFHEDDIEKRIKAVWANELESSSSYFWKRNNYPNITRFVCFDMVATNNSFFTKQLFSYWMTVLTLAINSIEVNTLQAYRLYQSKVDIDPKMLGELISRHTSKLHSARQNLRERMKQNPVTVFSDDRELLANIDIPVYFESFDSSSVKMNTDELGLVKDRPKTDTNVWFDQIFTVRRNINYLHRIPYKATDIASESAHSKINEFYGGEYQLDKYQVLDLNEQLSEIESKMYDATSIQDFDFLKFNEDLSKQEKKILKEMSLRMPFKVALFSGSVALLIYLTGYASFIYNSYDQGLLSFGFATALGLLATVLVSLGGVVVLWIYKRKLEYEFQKFNTIIVHFVDRIMSNAAIIEDYLGKTVTYMKGQSILQGMRFKKETFTHVRQKLNRHYLALKNQIDIEESWAKAFNVGIEFEYIPSSMTYFDIDVQPNENYYYRLDNNQEITNIAINDSGRLVSSPYYFVTKLYLERIDLFDQSEEIHS